MHSRSNNVGSSGGKIGSVLLQEAKFTVRILSPPVLDLLQELGVYSNHANYFLRIDTAVCELMDRFLFSL